MKRLICNGPLMLMFFGASAETAIGAISSTFNVKYLQTQFQTSPATAALLLGKSFVVFIITRINRGINTNQPWTLT